MFFNKSLNKCATAGITAVMAFIWAGAPLAQAQSALDTEDQQAAIFADQVQASLLALEDGDRDAPRDHWDPQYVVDAVGIDPGDLFAWEQANVAFVPYLGALRGAEGVLMDRVGNSLDQSLLLAALLTDAGYPARLAHADLAPAAVDGLWAELAAARAAQVLAPIEADQTAADATEAAPQNASLLDAADLYGLDRSGVGEVIDTTNADAAQLFVDVAPNVDNATAALADIVGLKGAGDTSTGIVAAAKAALSDHWWVEYQDNGAWIGLDLMAPDAASGPLVAAADTFDPASLPEAAEQLVTIRVIAEQLKGGALSEKVVLEQTLKPRDLLGSTMGFRHFPMAWPEDWPQMTPDDVQIKLRAALYAQTEWLPVLTLADAVVGSAGILDTGELDPTPHPVNPFMQMTTAMIGMVSKATDVLATGGDNEQLLAADPELDTPRPPREEGELVSERLEFIISRPGANPIVTSRDVFDLVGPDVRAKGDLSTFTMSGQKALDRSMAMLEESEIQVLSSKLDPDFLIHLGAQSALRNRPVLDDLSKDPFGKLPSNYMELFSKLTGLPYALYGLASLRFSLNNYSDWVYVDRPVVVLQHTRLRRAGGGDFLAGVSLDIVENGIGVDPFAADNAFGLRLSQGVADTFAEAAALQQIGTVQPNVASVFTASDQMGAGWIALNPGDQALLSAIGWNADAKARMSQELADGNLLVLPATPSDAERLAGWWRIDPATGQTLGVSASGHGQAMVEYAFILLIETIMAAAQCALEASLIKAVDKAVSAKEEGASLLDSARAGANAGVGQAKQDLSDSKLRNRCMALGMFAGFQSLLMGFAMHAVHTAGKNGYDGSKPSNSWERNAVNNAKSGSSTTGHSSSSSSSSGPSSSGSHGGPSSSSAGRSGPSTSPGDAPHSNGSRGPSTEPGLGPKVASNEAPPTQRSPVNPDQSPNTKRSPTPDESPTTKRAPTPDEAPQTKRSPGNDEAPPTQRSPGNEDAPKKGITPEPDGPTGPKTEPGLGPKGPNAEETANTQRAPNGDETANTQRAPNGDETANTQRAPNGDETANTQRAPDQQPQSPFDQFKDAQQRAIDAQQKLVEHTPVDTPEGQAETNKLWSDLDAANRDRIQAWDSMPKNQRPLSIPPVPEPAAGTGFAGNATSMGTIGAGSTDGGTSLGTAQTQVAAVAGGGGANLGTAPTQAAAAALPPPVVTQIGLQPTVSEAQATRASGLAGLMDALGPVATPCPLCP